MLNRSHPEAHDGVEEEDVVLTRENAESEQIKVHARRLRRRREFLGFSQSQLATRFKAANPDIKLAQSDISKWERSSGTTNKPRFAALAKFLGVTENWLRGIGTIMTAEGRTEREELELNGVDALGEDDAREEGSDEEEEGSQEGEPMQENPPKPPAPAIFELGLRTREPDPVLLPVPAPEPAPMVDAGLGDIVALLQAEVAQQLAGVNLEAEGTRKALKDGVKTVGESFSLCDIALTDLYEARRKDVSASIRSRITGVVAPRTSDAAKATAIQMLGDLETTVISVIAKLRQSIGEKGGTARIVPAAPKEEEPPKVEVAPPAPIPEPEPPVVEPPVVDEEEEEEEEPPVEEPEEPPAANTPPEMVRVRIPPKKVLVIGGFHPPHDDVQNAAMREHNIEIDWVQTDGKSTNQIDSAVKRISNPAKTVQGVIVVSGGFNHNFSTRVTYAAKMAGVPTAHANNQGPAQINRAIAKIASEIFPKTV